MGEGKSRAGPIATIGSVAVVAAAQTEPEEAISNIAGWLQLIGVDQVPPFLANAQTDAWVTALGLTALAASLLWWWWDRRRNRPATIDDWLRSHAIPPAAPSPRAEEWMPLHQALRYLVYDSEWSHQQSKPTSRDDFDRLLSLELRERLARGELRARGAKGAGFSNPDRPTEEIPPSYWIHGFIQPHGEIVMADPNRATAGNPTGRDTYRRVVISSGELADIWPRSSATEPSPLASFVEPDRKLFEGSKAAADDGTRKRREELIAKGRNVVHRFRQSGSDQGFERFASQDRDYLDIQPHLGDEYQAWRTRTARTAVATADGEDYRAAMFLRELARLEKEWCLV